MPSAPGSENAGMISPLCNKGSFCFDMFREDVLSFCHLCRSIPRHYCAHNERAKRSQYIANTARTTENESRVVLAHSALHATHMKGACLQVNLKKGATFAKQWKAGHRPTLMLANATLKEHNGRSISNCLIVVLVLRRRFLYDDW